MHTEERLEDFVYVLNKTCYSYLETRTSFAIFSTAYDMLLKKA